MAQRFKVDAKNIVVYGFRTNFGGGKSTGFALIYDSHQYLLKYEPKHRIRRVIIFFTIILFYFFLYSLELSPRELKLERLEKNLREKS